MKDGCHPVRTRDVVLVSLLGSVLVLVRLPGLVSGPRRNLWGATDGDALGLVWTLWHVAHHLFQEGRLGIRTEMVLFPHGGVLFPANPLEAILLSPVTRWLGPVFSFNLSQVLHVGLAAGFTYALLVALVGRRGPALALCSALALSPVLMATTHNGNNEVGQFFWLPLCGWLVWRVVHGVGLVGVLAAGICLALALISNVYVGVGALLVALVMAGAALPLRQVWRPLWPVLLVAALLAGPVLFYQGWVLHQGASVVEKGRDTVFRQRALEGAASLVGFLRPGIFKVPDPRGGTTPFVNAWATGWLLLLLALSRLPSRQRLDRACWLGVGLGVLLALGPVLKLGQAPLLLAGRYVPLPYVFLDRLPPFAMLIELWRFSAVVQVCLAVLAVRTLLAWRPSLWAGVAALLVLESLWLTPGPAVWRLDPLPDEPVAEILTGLEAGPVLSFPVRQGDWPLYYQTLHGQPVANSPMNAGDPAVFGLVSQGIWTPRALAETARSVGYRWLLLHLRPETLKEQPMDQLFDALDESGLVVRQQGNLALVDLRAVGPWPELVLMSRNLP